MMSVAVMRPETQAYIHKLEQEKMEKAKGQQADNRGFFAKYVSCIVLWASSEYMYMQSVTSLLL